MNKPPKFIYTSKLIHFSITRKLKNILRVKIDFRTLRLYQRIPAKNLDFYNITYIQ